MAKSKNDARTADRDFVKIYRDYMRALADLGMENPGALTVFLFLTKNMDGTNAIAISMETIAGFVKMSRQTVSKHLKYLASKGWIKRIGMGTLTVYAVNDCVAWTSYGGEQKEYSKFNLTTILDKDAVSLEEAYYDSVYENNWNLVKGTRQHIRTVQGQNDQRKILAANDDTPEPEQEHFTTPEDFDTYVKDCKQVV